MSYDLNVYGQDFFHDPAFLVGTREGLIALKEAIEGALAKPNGLVEENFFACDGEGYTLVVGCESQEQFNRYKAPYTGEFAQSSYGTNPHELLRRVDNPAKP